MKSIERWLFLNQDSRDSRMDQDQGMNQDSRDSRMDQELGMNQDSRDSRIDQDYGGHFRWKSLFFLSC